MKVTKEDLKKAINNVVTLQFNLNIAKMIADKSKVLIEECTIGDQPYSEVIKEIINSCNELDILLEAAKESVIDNLDKNTITQLNKFDRFDGDLAQEYYISEKYANLPFILNRAKKLSRYTLKKEYPYLLRENIGKLFCAFWMEDLIPVVPCVDLLQKFS